MMSDEKFLRKKENDEKYQTKIECLKNHPEINHFIRAVVVDWMKEVCQEYEYSRETFHIAVNYMDRYLGLTKNFMRKKIQLLGITCLFIASKLDEDFIHRQRKAIEFVDITANAYNVKELLEMERNILNILDFYLYPSTVYSWVRYYTNEIFQKGKENIIIENMEIIDIAILDIYYLGFRPSILSTTILLITQPELKDMILSISNYKLSELESCQTFLNIFVKHFPRPTIDCLNGDLQTHNPETLKMYQTYIKKVGNYSSYIG